VSLLQLAFGDYAFLFDLIELEPWGRGVADSVADDATTGGEDVDEAERRRVYLDFIKDVFQSAEILKIGKKRTEKKASIALHACFLFLSTN